MFGIASSGGTIAYQKQAPTRDAADRLVDARLAAPNGGDANDAIYQWDASRDYDPSPGLERISAPLLAINSADDRAQSARNRDSWQRSIARIKNAQDVM